MLSPLFSPELKSEKVMHAFFTREGGCSQGIYASLNVGLGSDDNSIHVHENRGLVTSWFGLKAQLCTVHQIHSDTVVTVTKPWAYEDAPQADAMVTTQPNIVLGVLAADCVPILFADAKAGVVGAAHSGWKGAISHIGVRTVEAMEQLGADRREIVATIGPCIQQSSYEVDAGFRERFLEQAAENEAFFVPSKKKPDHFHFDLPGYVRKTLEDARVGAVNLLANDTCFEEDTFFSYRRKTLRGEADYGRQISAIMLTP